MDNNSIKENIRKIRKSQGLTQEEIAHRLGISLTAYRDIEKGDTSIVNNKVYKIAEVTGVSTEELVLGYRPAESESSLEDIRNEYSSQTDILLKRIADLEKLVTSLEETVASKNEIIAMLKKNIGEER